MFIVYFVFNWFTAPRFGLNCQIESETWTMCRTKPGNYFSCHDFATGADKVPCDDVYVSYNTTGCKITPGVFTCASDVFDFAEHPNGKPFLADPICCKINNNQFAPFILIAFLFANAKAGMAAIAIIADFFLEVKKGKKELGGGR